MKPQYQIAAYYFPNYHQDPRNEIVHGSGWTEWELVKHATPRFPGHIQPRQPLWGYENEADPGVMGKKIAAAVDHGVNIFLYDWYWYDSGPFLHRCLEQGFLKATNNQHMKFAIHWANHDWLDIHPASYANCARGEHRLLYPGKITPQTFKTLVEHVIQHYFKHPAYWLIDEAPYFSIYDLPSLVRSFAGVKQTADALAYFRARTQEEGFPDLHLNQVLWNSGILPGETAVRNPGALLKDLGFDSFTSYVWIHHVPLETFPETDYEGVFRRYLQYWEQVEAEIDLPYFPNATMGWDSSPRTVQSDRFGNVGYPFTPCLRDNTPEQFNKALREIRHRMDRPGSPKVLTINAWNEWTEGSYLEPDTIYKMGYLKALQKVFT
jgi:hypothetical protein